MAYQFDFPVGPTDVVLLGGLYAMAWVVIKLIPGGLRQAKKKLG
jgi:hypothetical protein